MPRRITIAPVRQIAGRLTPSSFACHAPRNRCIQYPPMEGFITSSDSEFTPVGRRLAALALVVAGVGLPINHLFGYALLVIATVLIFVDTVSARMKSWLVAAALVGLCVLG